MAVRTASSELHSGSYGGSVANAAHVLTALLAALHGPAGDRVAAPGFYDDVATLSEAERAELRKLPFDAATDIAAAGALLATSAPHGRMVLSRLTPRDAQAWERTSGSPGSPPLSAAGEAAQPHMP